MAIWDADEATPLWRFASPSSTDISVILGDIATLQAGLAAEATARNAAIAQAVAALVNGAAPDQDTLSEIASRVTTALLNDTSLGERVDDLEASIDGLVAGPVASTDGQLPLFSGITGKLLKTLAMGALGSMLMVNGAGSLEFSRFVQAGAGAVEMRWTDAVRGAVVTPEQFGAVGDAVTDDTVAIQKAVDTGKHVVLSKKIYIVSAVVNVTIDGTRISGSGNLGTQIYNSTNTVKTFNVPAHDVTISNLSTNYSVAGVAGATAFHVTGSQFEAHSMSVNNCHIGFYVSCTDSHIHHFRVYNYVHSAVWCQNAGAISVDNFLLDAITPTNGAFGGIRLSDFCETFLASNGNILNGVYSLATSATSYAAGSRPAYSGFSKVYFDSPANGVLLNNIVDTVFTGCWFSGGRSGPGNPGCTLATTANLTFMACQFNNCGSNGGYVSSASTNTKFLGCEALGNGVNAGAGIADGFYVEPGTQGFQFSHCTSGNLLFGVGVQRYGIYIAAGGSNHYTVTLNDLRGNAAGALFDGGTGTDKVISDNLGTTQNFTPFDIVPLKPLQGLGTATAGWSAFHGKTGFELNLENSNWRAVHSSGVFDVVTGEWRIQTPGTNAKSVVVREAVREKLSAARTYYVRTDGNNSNTGLVDSAVGAFATIQGAWTQILKLDQAGFGVTVQVRDGTHTTGFVASSAPSGPVTIQGNSGTPANCLISTVGDCFASSYSGPNLLVRHMRLASSAGCAIVASSGANVTGQGLEFGACSVSHCRVVGGAGLVLIGNYSIVGGALHHFQVLNGGRIELASSTVNVTTPVTFGTAFASSDTCGVISAFGIAFTGSAVTGQRFLATVNGVINTYSGANANYFPGSVAGAEAVGGRYV